MFNQCKHLNFQLMVYNFHERNSTRYIIFAPLTGIGMKLLLLGITFLLSFGLSAQVLSYEILTVSDSTGFLDELNVYQDARVDSMLKNHISMNQRKKGTDGKQGMDGYRLEIFFSSGLNARGKALEVKTDFLKNFPEENAYISFLSPNFKVRVGDFRTKNEAIKLKHKIRRHYPNAFVVKDIIQFPELYTERKSNE